MEATYFLYELTEIDANRYQYVQVDGEKPLTQGEVEARDRYYSRR